MNKLAVIHPDHLLDQARRNTLAPDERRRLGAHLAVCGPCAWEQAATDDFAREQAVVGFDPEQLDRLVDGALSRAGILAEPRPRQKQQPASRWGLAAAALLAAAIGAAMTLPARSPGEGARVDPLASTDANLDAGAIGAGVGDDS
jgi:membrane-bound lytic murein transglycosylase B